MHESDNKQSRETTHRTLPVRSGRMNNHIDPVMTESHNAPVNDDIGDH
jgi:hypothetical protein